MLLKSMFSTIALTGYPVDPESSAQAAADSIQQQSLTTSRRIIDYRHPDYTDDCLYRDAWVGGAPFCDKYLVSLSNREDPLSEADRRKVTYCPAIAKGAVAEIKNAIFARANDVIRKDGPASYMTAVNGDTWGVDNLGSSMDNFINKCVLPELLVMRTVGVYIDRPDLGENYTALAALNKRPYLYTYKHEDILAWVPDDSHEPNQFKVLLLRENYLETDELTGLPICWSKRYRFLRVVEDHVEVMFFDQAGKQLGVTKPIKMKIIPFVLFEISESLLTDIAMIQVCLMNLASSDMSYALKANFPFYTEEYDPKSEPGFYKTGVQPIDVINKDAANINIPKQNPNQASTKEEISVGIMHGRRHPKGTATPAFIHPSSEPLLASMKKQDQLEIQIRKIMSLWMSNVTAGSVDAELQDNQQTLDSGLKNIGMELEHGERSLMMIWGLYTGENSKGTVKYPETYYVKTDAARRAEAKEINELKSAIPSVIYQKETAKQTAYALFHGKLPDKTLNEIFDQIQAAETMTCNVEEIEKDIQNGLVGLELASTARGYPKGQVAIAKKEQAERLALIQAAQTTEGGLKNPGSRGVPDGSPNPKLDAKTEKAAQTIDPIKPPEQRGPAQ